MSKTSPGGNSRRLWRRSVIQQHVKGTRTNVELLTTFGIRPIVQTRSLYDVVVSLYDHFERDNNSLPCGFICDQYWQMRFQERLDYLIGVHLPWYFNFFLSWRHAAHHIEILPLTYEKLFADRLGCLREILSFYHLSASDEQIESAIRRMATAKTRLNVGVNGRGMEMLSPRHQQLIQQQADTCQLELDEKGSIVTDLLRSGANFLPRTSQLTLDQQVA